MSWIGFMGGQTRWITNNWIILPDLPIGARIDGISYQQSNYRGYRKLFKHKTKNNN